MPPPHLSEPGLPGAARSYAMGVGQLAAEVGMTAASERLSFRPRLLMAAVQWDGQDSNPHAGEVQETPSALPVVLPSQAPVFCGITGNPSRAGNYRRPTWA